MSMGKQNCEKRKEKYLHELSGSKFHSVPSSNVILYNDVKNSIFIKSGLLGFGNELFNIAPVMISPTTKR